MARSAGSWKRRSSNLRKMDDIEAAWVGAFIEADGAASIQPKLRRVCIEVGQKDPEPIATLLRLTGVGSVGWDPAQQLSNGYYRGGVLRWVVNAWNETKELAERCAPYCPKLQLALEWMIEFDLEREARATR